MDEPRPPDESYAAIVLAGGAGSRLGGVDKATIDIDGRTLLDRALAAVDQAARIVVVGPTRPVPEHVVVTQERPPGGGPVAAVAAGLVALGELGDERLDERLDLVVVLACDMPFVDAGAVEQLVTAATTRPGDGAALVDADGRRQHLAAAYRIIPLRAALHAMGDVDGAAMRHVVQRLTMVEIEADPEITLDTDTWSDVRRSQTLAQQRRAQERAETRGEQP
jgi:molybdopterin-guanine dinucleotide biosynthesis protein A